MKLWLHIAALAALMLAAVAPAAAQPVPDGLEGYLVQQLDVQRSDVGQDGYALAAGPLTGSLAERRAGMLTVTLRAGQHYRIAGVCDARCGDLDLRLIDPRRSVVAEDARGNDHPVLDLRPAITGQHTIQVGMARCEAERCWFAVNVYTR